MGSFKTGKCGRFGLSSRIGRYLVWKTGQHLSLWCAICGKVGILEVPSRPAGWRAGGRGVGDGGWALSCAARAMVDDGSNMHVGCGR